MRIFIIILVVIIAIGAIYSVVRWVAGEVSLSGTFSRYRDARYSEREPSSNQKPSAEVSRSDEGEVQVGFEKPSGLTEEIPEGFESSDLSPDFGKIEVTSFRRPSASGAGGGFTLRSDFTQGDPVDVTNWSIIGNENKEIRIRGGISSVPPVNLTRIVIRPRTSAVFYADTNSFVKNIELNKCTGYLNKTYNFDPKAPNNCPRPDRSEIIGFSGECQNFIRSLSACEQPTGTDLNRFAGVDDVACHEFLEDLNYGNCVREHSKDSDFYSYGWRVWMSDRLPFDRSHDRLLLLDEEGLIVDEYVY
jgi:hypothetical protein